jgi:hypothetical protein
MQVVKYTVRAPGGVNGCGHVFVISHHGDNALVTLR